MWPILSGPLNRAGMAAALQCSNAKIEVKYSEDPETRQNRSMLPPDYGQSVKPLRCSDLPSNEGRTSGGARPKFGLARVADFALPALGGLTKSPNPAGTVGAEIVSFPNGSSDPWRVWVRKRMTGAKARPTGHECGAG